MKKTITLSLLDFATISIMGLVSHWAVFGTVRDADLFILLGLPAVFILSLSLVKFYRLRIANSSIELIKKAVYSLLPATVIVVLAVGEMRGFTSRGTRWTVVYSVFAFLAVVGTRAYWRIYMESDKSDNPKKPVALIYGAGDMGSAMARQAKKGSFDYRILGFIDDKDGLQHEIVLGYNVLGKLDDLDGILKNHHGKIDALIIAITNLPAPKIQQAVITARKHGIDTKIVPNLFETKGRTDVSLRELNIEDLLGRSLNTVDKEPLFDMFSGKTVLVTGAGGSIGSEICNQLMEYGLKRLILLDIDETELHDLALRLLGYEHEWSDKVIPVVCDIRNAEKVERITARYKPDIVFHAAAYKHVPLMELYPEEAIITNIKGSYNVFRSCRNNSVKKVVVISTDKAVNPTNVMGATKRVVEMMAASLNCEDTEFCCVRFGNVIGSRGSMLPLFLEEIKAGKPITVTDRKIIRYFMAIPEAVSLVFRAASLAKGGEVMVLDMGEPVNIYDFAQKLIDAFGDGRSTIKVTGLRPGEKLYEELLANKDNTIPTDIQKVFRAKVNPSVFKNGELAAFIDNLSGKSPDELVWILEDTVPEFQRANRQIE